MQLKQKTRYAIRILLCLAQDHQCLTAVELAQWTDVPYAQLNRIVADLRDAGIVETSLGCKGGYRLRKSPQFVSLYDVMVAVDDLFQSTNRALESVDGKMKRSENEVMDTIQRELATALRCIMLDRFCMAVPPYPRYSQRRPRCAEERNTVAASRDGQLG